MTTITKLPNGKRINTYEEYKSILQGYHQNTHYIEINLNILNKGRLENKPLVKLENNIAWMPLRYTSKIITNYHHKTLKNYKQKELNDLKLSNISNYISGLTVENPEKYRNYYWYKYYKEGSLSIVEKHNNIKLNNKFLLVGNSSITSRLIPDIIDVGYTHYFYSYFGNSYLQVYFKASL